MTKHTPPTIDHSLYRLVSTELSSLFSPSVGQLSPMLQASACRLRLTRWEISVATFFSSRKSGSETTLDCQGTRGLGRFQGKSDWQVPIIVFRVPRLKTLQPASHLSLFNKTNKNKNKHELNGRKWRTDAKQPSSANIGVKYFKKMIMVIIKKKRLWSNSSRHMAVLVTGRPVVCTVTSQQHGSTVQNGAREAENCWPVWLNWS